MATGLSAAVANSLLDALFNQSNYTAPTAIWIQLHTADPGAAGTTAVATETTRKNITTSFSASASGAVTNDVAVTWTAVAGTEDYTHWSLWTLVSGGSFIISGTVTANAVTSGDTFTIPIGDIDVAFSTAA